MFGESEWQLVSFTARMALLSTVLIAPPAIAVGWVLAHWRWPGRAVAETLVALPLALPPVATGLLLLELFSPRGSLGAMLETWGMDVVFTWRAVVVALAVMAFPLLARSARVAFEEVEPRLEAMARTLGASAWRVFWTISLPLAWRGVLAGGVLAFARALGEFGATIMIAGNIPGRTQTLSLAIYQNIQTGRDATAYALLGWSLVLAFGAVLLSEWMTPRRRRT